MTSYTNVFTGNPIQISPTSYRAFTIGSNTALSWPISNEDDANVTADIMEVIASTTSLTLAMPPANQVSNGTTCIIRNVGSNTFTVTDAGGNTIIAIAASTVYYVYVTDNSTVNGTWSKFQYGTGSSSADAASLAGYGLVALSTTLNLKNTPVTKAANYTILASDRASTLVWTAGAGTFSLTAAATLTAGWFCYVKNFGSGVLTLDPNGAELIDGVDHAALSPNESCMIVCTGTAFYTVARSSSGTGSITQYIATNGLAPASIPSVNPAATSSIAIGSGALVDAGGIGAMALGNSYVTGSGALSIAINNDSSAYGAQATSSVAIGLQNKVSGTNIQGAAIGGDSNIAAGNGGNTILAGEANQVTGGTFNAIVAGVTNHITAGSISLIAGGESNTISSAGQHNGIFEGIGNAISASGDGNLILGGDSNSIEDTAASSGIIASQGASITGTSDSCFIISAAGANINNSSASVVVGGDGVIDGSVNSAIVAGVSAAITSTGDGNAIIGGSGSTISGTTFSCVAMGDTQTISGTSANSAALGKGHSITSANYSIATGYQGASTTNGKALHAVGHFTANGDAQTSYNVLRASTVGAVTSELLIGGTTQLVLPNDTTWLAWIHIVARRTDTDGFSAAFTRYVAIDRNTNAASTALVAAVQTIGTDFNDSTYSVTISADTTNGALKIEATGVALHTVQFVAFVRLVETTG